MMNDNFSFLFDWILGIAFLGSPNRGSTAATTGSNITYLGKKFGLGTEDKILKDIQKDSDTLFELRNNFVRWLKKSNVLINCMFEQQKTGVIVGKRKVSIWTLKDFLVKLMS